MADLVRIRISGIPTAAEAVVERVRAVVDVAEVSREYRGRDPHDPTVRRYLSALVEPARELSPRARAEAAKARRDLQGELATLMEAGRDLSAQPWLPILPGDVVAWWAEGIGHGETLVAVEDPDWQTEAGAPLRLVSQTGGAHTELALAGDIGPDAGPRYQDFSALWFEAGPELLTVIREGRVIHGRPAQAGLREGRRRG